MTTVFENHQKCLVLSQKRLCNFGIFHQFCPNWPVWPQNSGFQKLAKIVYILGIFNELLSNQNVNIARFARNVEWDFFSDFQTLWKHSFDNEV